MSKARDIVAGDGCTVTFIHGDRGERTCVLGQKPKRIAGNTFEPRVPRGTPIGDALYGSRRGDRSTAKNARGEEEPIVVIQVMRGQRTAAV